MLWRPASLSGAELSAARLERAADRVVLVERCYLRFFCLAMAAATRSPVMNMWL